MTEAPAPRKKTWGAPLLTPTERTKASSGSSNPSISEGPGSRRRMAAAVSYRVPMGAVGSELGGSSKVLRSLNWCNRPVRVQATCAQPRPHGERRQRDRCVDGDAGGARSSSRDRPSAVSRPVEGCGLELTRFRGHPQTCGGGHDAEEPTAVFVGVPAADGRPGAWGADARFAIAGVRADGAVDLELDSAGRAESRGTASDGVGWHLLDVVVGRDTPPLPPP